MPERYQPEAKNQPEFHESLSPTLPLTSTDTTTLLRSPIVGAGLWIVAVILIGSTVGLAIRNETGVITYIGAPGPVAIVTNLATDRIPVAARLATPVSDTPNLAVMGAGSSVATGALKVSPVAATYTVVQATVATDALFYTGDINALQSGFSAYGTQGGVGIAASR